jgi:hypothetical protein
MFEHLASAPWGVEYLRGRAVTSLRDGATAVIETVTNTGLAYVQWLDAQSSKNNSGETEVRTVRRGNKASQTTVFVGTVDRHDEEWVLADKAAVLAAFPDVAPLPETVIYTGTDDTDDADWYTNEEVLSRPIPAKCPKCKRAFLGRDAILAPSLDNVCCFYCGPNRGTRLVLHPDHKGFIDAKSHRAMTVAPLFHHVGVVNGKS